MLSTHPCHQTHCIRRFDTHSSGEGLLTGHFLHYKSLMEWGGTSVTKFRSWGGYSGWYGVPTNPPLTEHGPPPWYHGSDNNGYCTEHHSLIKSIIPTTTNTLHHINMLHNEGSDGSTTPRQFQCQEILVEKPMCKAILEKYLEEKLIKPKNLYLQ